MHPLGYWMRKDEERKKSLEEMVKLVSSQLDNLKEREMKKDARTPRIETISWNGIKVPVASFPIWAAKNNPAKKTTIPTIYRIKFDDLSSFLSSLRRSFRLLTNA